MAIGKEGIERKINESWKKVWETAIEQSSDPGNNTLLYIIKYIEPSREKAWKKLLEKGPTKDELLYIILHVEPLREEASKVLKRRPKKEVIKEIIEKIINFLF